MRRCWARSAASSQAWQGRIWRGAAVRSLQAKRRAASCRERKQALTSACSSRWAGAITRTSEDAWGVAERNLIAEAVTLRARIDRIRRRLAVPVGGRCGRNRGYESAGERYQKQRRLQVLQFRIVRVEARLDDGRVSICRGGRRLARARHHLDEVGITAVQWQQRWQASRLFIWADGEADKWWGNETIRFHPDKGWWRSSSPGRSPTSPTGPMAAAICSGSPDSAAPPRNTAKRITSTTTIPSATNQNFARLARP